MKTLKGKKAKTQDKKNKELNIKDLERVAGGDSMNKAQLIDSMLK